MDKKRAPVQPTGVNTEQYPTAYSIAQFECAYMKRFGLSLFPIKERDKVPMTPNGFKDATHDYTAYEALHGGRAHNVGMPTGALNKVFVLDIDPRHGGHETFRHLMEQYGPLPGTWHALTQSGGSHYFFKWDERRPVSNRTNFLPGLDIRGEGGYVLLPPSIVEGSYKWLRSPSKYPLLDAPDWLYQAIEVDKHKGVADLSRLADGVNDGQRNVSLTQLTGMLLGKNVNVELAWALVESYNRCYVNPPISESELLKTFTSIAKREVSKRQRRWGRQGA